ncbi:MAG: hypothetical protein AAFY56_22885 [Pseudomonadota bacterium]
MLESFVASGRVIDVVLAVLCLEIVGLYLWHRRTGRGPSLRVLLALALPGAFLMLALRIALTGGPATWLLILLVASFAAHLFDLRTRW